MPLAMRRLFENILVYYQPVDVMKLWDTYLESMSKVFQTIHQFTHETQILNKLISIDSSFFCKVWEKLVLIITYHLWI